MTMTEQEQRIRHNEVCREYYARNSEYHKAYMSAHRHEYKQTAAIRLFEEHDMKLSDDPERLSVDFLLTLYKK